MSEEQKDTIFRFAMIFIALLIGFICVVVKIVRLQRFASDRWLAIAEKQKPVDYHAQKIKEISKRLNWPTKNGKIEAIIDSAANQRTLASEKSVSELFYDCGILVNPYVNKDLFSGINRVKSYFKNANNERKLFIFKTCVNLIREIKGYFWGNADVPIKKDDHALDELRYYIMSRPENKIALYKPKTPLQINKERLIKQNKMNNKNYW